LAKCVFLTNKEVYCQQHRATADEEDILPEADINVARCIFVETHPDSSGKKIQRMFEVDKLSVKIGKSECIHVHIHILFVEHFFLLRRVLSFYIYSYKNSTGSLHVHSLGKLVEFSDTPTRLLPDKYR
jgi:hypothetical protein